MSSRVSTSQHTTIMWFEGSQPSFNSDLKLLLCVKSRLLVSPSIHKDTATMFKSSFAQEMLQETRQHKQLQDEILPKELGGGVYKSQFAASTHGPLDNVNISLEDDQEVRRTGSKYGNIDNINESGDQAINMNHELHTSDLGTSDFSSSELWPPSTSSSPFEYTPRYRGVVSGSGSSLHADNRDNRVNSQGSFLNLQSSMQFSYLKRVRKSEKCFKAALFDWRFSITWLG